MPARLDPLHAEISVRRGQLLTPRARRWLANGRPARILHRFAGVCNLVNAAGEVLSVCAPGLPAGPFTLRLDGELPAGLHAALPVRAAPDGGWLQIGPLRVETAGARTWQPRPPWGRFQSAWLANLPEPDPLPAHLVIHLRDVLRGIAAGDAKSVRTGAHALAGLGPGLTPAGDDLLMGVLHGLSVWRPGSRWPALLASTAVPRTTTLSAAFLRAAAAGEAAEPWHGLVNGRLAAVDAILATGHSSGPAAWAGFVWTGRCLSELDV